MRRELLSLQRVGGGDLGRGVPEKENLNTKEDHSAREMDTLLNAGELRLARARRDFTAGTRDSQNPRRIKIESSKGARGNITKETRGREKSKTRLGRWV